MMGLCSRLHREYQDCCVTADARLEFIEDLTANIRLCLKRHVRGIRRPFDVILLRVKSLDVFDSIFNAGRGLVRNLPLEEDAFKDGYDEDSIPRYIHCSASQLKIVGMRPPPMPSCVACSITRGVGVDMAVSTSHPTSTSLSPTCRRSWPT